MALRYDAAIDNAAVMRVEPDKVVPRFPAPGRVEFRPGTNVANLAEQLLQCQRVQLCAAVGAGKSVRVPEALVHRTKGLVVHCVPSSLLALNLYRYVSTVAKVDTFYIDGTQSPLPKKGIAFVGAADFVRRVVAMGKDHKDGLPYVLFLDECHESDCFTEVLRSLGPDLPGCTNLILSSATFDPDGGRKAETAGVRVDRILSDVDVTDWDPEEDGKPWSVSALDQDTLMFVDRPKMVEKLRISYNENGFYAFVLTARMTVQSFEHILEVLARHNRPVVVLIADYSFRSGHTFPSIGIVIDSGEVAYYGEVDGAPARLYRRAYKFEVEQAAGRGGRVPGMPCVCWKPNNPEAKMCDVDGTEADAVPLLYRMLGYRPPKKYSEMRFYSGDVPDNLSEALRGKMPLFAWRSERLTPWVGGCVQPVQQEIICEPVIPAAVCPAQRPRFSMPVMPDGTQRAFRPPSPQLVALAPIRTRSISPVSKRSSSANSFVEAPFEQPADEPCQPKVSGRLSVPFDAGVPVMEIVAGGNEHVAKHPPVGDDVQLWSGLTSVLQSVQTAAVNDKLSVGEYAYMPGIEACEQPHRWFPGGMEAVHRLVAKPHVVAGMDYQERLNALKILVDPYNDAVARLRAVHRITTSIAQVSASMGACVQPDDLKTWVLGLMEKCAEDKAIVKSLSDDMLRLFAGGYREIGDEMKEACGERELSFVQCFVHQLEMMVSDIDPGGQGKYAGHVRDRPREGVLLPTVSHKAIMPSERSHAEEELRTVRPATSRELAVMSSSQGKLVGKYRLQPSSGLPSFFARALVKAVGEGDVHVQVG